MSDLRFNAIAGAVLASALGVMAVNWGADELFAPHYPEKAGFMPDVAASGGEGEGPAAEAGPPDWGTLFADPAQLAALVERGDRLHGACLSCHNADPGGSNGIGPALYGVFGRTAGTHAGFSYSDAMKAYGQPWTYDNLYAFLERPNRYIVGTAMSFAGLRKSEDRVALVAYLHSISDSPAPIPAPRAPAAEATAAPVEAGTEPAAAAEGAPAAPAAAPAPATPG
jgi:cytochrome c